MTKMIIVTLLFFALSALNGYASQKKSKPNCTVVIAADLHFDMPPETDQFHHVVAINTLGEHRKIDAVVLAGDLFDKSAPAILDLYRRRWERGADARQIHYDVYPCYGNHDISPESGRPELNKLGCEFNLHYLDSILIDKLNSGQIVNLHRPSRSYSYNIGGVHFVCAQLAFGDTSYSTDNMQWVEDDLKRFASDGTPVVFVQHYGFDGWAQEWWKKENRDRLMSLLGHYRLAAFLVGHTHASSVETYHGCPIMQVNNAWDDGDGKASFVVLSIKGDKVSADTYEVLDGEGNTRLLQPQIKMNIPINQ